MNKVTVKNRVKELRKQLRLRQSDLAGQIGVSRQTILAIEKGRLNPSILLSLKISRALGKTADFVFYLDTPAEEGESIDADTLEEGAPLVASHDASRPAAVWDFS